MIDDGGVVGESVADSAASFGRVPAAAVITACLQAQAAVPARSRLARAFGRSPLSNESRPWYLGALGERQVAAQLAKLGAGWTVLHSVPIGDRGSDIDHVVIGSPGIFTINAKYHEDARVWVGSRRLLVNGQKTDHLRNSRYEAQRVARDIARMSGEPIDVHPAIVVVGARSITIREQPADVAVLRDTQLVRWLTRRPAVLSPEGRDRLAAMMTRREAWSGTSESGPTVDVLAFDALRREVQAAWRVRALWGLAALVGFVAVAGGFVMNAYSTLLGG